MSTAAAHARPDTRRRQRPDRHVDILDTPAVPPVVDDATRRELLAMLAAAGLLAACADGDGGNGEARAAPQGEAP